MAQSLATLNQIAAKRLSGKAMTSGITTLAGEKIGSTVQTIASTVFGESLPNNPDSGSAYWYLIQSASNSEPGTVQYVEFILEPVASSNYDNDGAEDTNAFAGEDPFSDITDETDGSPDPLTYHAYAIKLPDTYVTLVNNASADFDTNASTNTALGTGVFSNGYYTTGSRGKLQVVPEYVSNLPVNNPYVPVLVASNGEIIAPSDPIDWYFDSYAGVLFVQDPSDYGTIGNPNIDNDIPAKLRAFLYVGKYQDEISGGDTVNLHFSASEGGGFSISNNATASFETGSTSGDGLTITAQSDNSIEFNLVGVISGSEQFEGPTTINITASYAEEAVEVEITDTQDTVYHPIVFTKDSVSNTPTNGAISFEKLAISNNGSLLSHGLHFRPDSAVLNLVDNSTNYLSISPSQIVGNNNSFDFLAGTSIIRIGGSNTDTISIGGVDHGTTTTATGTFKVNSWDAQDEVVYNSTVTGSFGIDLVHPNTGSFTISNISESTERTPLVIDGNGKVTQADQDFAAYIVGEGGGLESMNIEEGTNQGQIQIQSSSNGVTSAFEQIDVKDLGTDDTPQFVGIKATNAAFNLATVYSGDQTITIGNASNGGNQITLNGTASITGDLIVQGVTTTLNTTNLLVEDKFVLLNSGTLGNPQDEGGIIVQTANNGTGTALFYDDDAKRWIITAKDQVAGTANNVTTDITSGSNTMAAIVTVQVDDGAPTHNPFFDTADFNQGQMFVDKSVTSTTGNNIWIYA